MVAAIRTFTGETDGDYKGTATNWYADTEPVANDYVRIALENASNIIGDDYTALSMATWMIEKNMPKLVGTLALPLMIDAVAVTLSGTGAQHLYFNDASTINVLQAASNSTDNSYGLNLTGVENDNLLVDISGGGAVSIGWRGVASEYANIELARGTLYIGPGVITNADTKITTVKATGGKLTTNANIATGTFTGSSNVVVEAGAYSTALYGQESSSINITGGGTITLLDLDDGCFVDFDSNYVVPIIVTNCNVRSKNVRIRDTYGRVTWAGGIVDIGGKFDLGLSKTLAIS